jgi:hypothetical protein
VKIIGSITIDETLVKLKHPSRKILTIKFVKIHYCRIDGSDTTCNMPVIGAKD